MPRRTKTNNIRLVSERAGVSVATVSRVVNNRTDVSEELRKKIQTVIDELNFSPNKGSKRVFNIGVIISQEKPLMDEYLSELITGMSAFIGTESAESAQAGQRAAPRSVRSSVLLFLKVMGFLFDCAGRVLVCGGRSPSHLYQDKHTPHRHT